MRQIIMEKDWNYVLYKEGGSYVLSVLCGRVGLFETTMLISMEDLADFRNEGDKYIDSLAERVRKDPEKFAKGSH